jgi:cell division protease FtsH
VAGAGPDARSPVLSLPSPPQARIEKKFSAFIEAVEKGEVAEVVIQGHRIHGQLRNHKRFKTFVPEDPDLIPPAAREEGGDCCPAGRRTGSLAVFVHWVPWLLLIGVGLFLLRR